MVSRANFDSDNIRDIFKKCSFDTFIAIDVDNTIITTKTAFGSDQWFVKLIEHASKIILDEEEAARLVIAIGHAVQWHIQTKPVEPEIVSIIKALQDIGIPVVAVTARGSSILAPTIYQLNEAGIDFSRKWEEESFSLGFDHKRKPMFYNGIIFCDGADKATCLEKFLERKRLKVRHLLGIDDKEKNVLNLQDFAKRRGIRFDGLRYAFLDKEAENVDMSATTQELLQIQHLLPYEAQDAIERLEIKSLLRNSLFNNEQTDQHNIELYQEEKIQNKMRI